MCCVGMDLKGIILCVCVNFTLLSRSRSRSRERVPRPPGGHRPMRHSRSPPPPHLAGPGGAGGHVSVHSRLGAMPPRNAEVIQREMAERDMYMRDRERQVRLSINVSTLFVGCSYLLCMFFLRYA